MNCQIKIDVNNLPFANGEGSTSFSAETPSPKFTQDDDLIDAITVCGDDDNDGHHNERGDDDNDGHHNERGDDDNDSHHNERDEHSRREPGGNTQSAAQIERLMRLYDIFCGRESPTWTGRTLAVFTADHLRNQVQKTSINQSYRTTIIEKETQQETTKASFSFNTITNIFVSFGAKFNAGKSKAKKEEHELIEKREDKYTLTISPGSLNRGATFWHQGEFAAFCDYLKKLAKEPSPSELLEQVHSFGTHFVSEVHVGNEKATEDLKLSKSCKENIGTDANIAANVVDLKISGNKNTAKTTKTDRRTSQINGQGEKFAALLIKLTPSWKLDFLTEAEKRALRNLFYLRLRQQQKDAEEEVHGNFGGSCAVSGDSGAVRGGRPKFPRSCISCRILIANDPALKIEHRSRLKSFTLRLNTVTTNARFQIWSQDTGGGKKASFTLKHEQPIVFSESDRDDDGDVEILAIDGGGKDVIVYSNDFFGIAFPQKCPINFQPRESNDERFSWSPVCRQNRFCCLYVPCEQRKDNVKFVRDNLGGDKGFSVPFISLTLVPDSIKFYKDVLCNDELRNENNERIEVSFGDPTFDKLKILKEKRQRKEFYKELAKVVVTLETNCRNLEKDFEESFTKASRAILAAAQQRNS